jgi:acyl carrier protein
MPDDTFEQIRTIVASRLGIDPGNLTLATTLIDDPEVDDPERIEIIMEFEDVFDVMISGLVAGTIATVRDAVTIIER